MIVSPNPQGSDEWHKDRAGIPSASNFKEIITPTGKATVGSKADTYRNQLIAEWHVGGPVDSMEPTFWMKRGIELEQEACDLYEFTKDVKIEKVGFCFKDEKKLVGCSPDGLVGDDGLWETKCPKAGTLIGYVLKGFLPSTYKPQVQGQLWVTDRDWCDFMAYHPDMTEFIIRVYRDTAYIKKLSDLADVFIEEMLEGRDLLKMKLKAA